MDQVIIQSVYDAILQRDTKYDGVYYTGIKTTKIVCRPSCKSRIPKRENVLLFSNVEDAIKAGFRPCKRCRPEQLGHWNPDARIAYELKKIILQSYEEPVTLEYLAEQMGISPYHLQRVFKRETGTTPAMFLQKVRVNKAKQLLQEMGLSILEISKLVGFRSPSHFSMVFKKYIGQSPNQYRTYIKKEGEANEC